MEIKYPKYRNTKALKDIAFGTVVQLTPVSEPCMVVDAAAFERAGIIGKRPQNTVVVLNLAYGTLSIANWNDAPFFVYDEAVLTLSPNREI